MRELYLHSRNTPSWRGAQLKHTDRANVNSKRVANYNLSV